jgi:membrane-associated protease RseP (regulator of RpoE activity)
MEDNNPILTFEPQPAPRRIISKKAMTYLIHLGLFFASFITTTLAGVMWVNKNPLELTNFHYGLPYSICLLAMLSAHEFGHYFAARFHGVDTSLPYFIPFPPFIILPIGSALEYLELNPFGTMGAVIRIRSPLATRKALFDIGIAGPVAGLVVTVVVLFYGLMTLPPIEYLYQIHPEYRFLATIPTTGLTLGNSIFFWSLRHFVGQHAFLPPMNEIYHYPYLCVGWFGLFITALNLLPVGQLDGGHIVYALVGYKHRYIARGFFYFMIALGLLSGLSFIGFRILSGTIGWLVWAAVLFFVIKLDHPPIYDETPLSPRQVLWGWVMMFVFFLIFTPIPSYE